LRQVAAGHARLAIRLSPSSYGLHVFAMQKSLRLQGRAKIGVATHGRIAFKANLGFLDDK
jgi:hypothetical protein